MDAVVESRRRGGEAEVTPGAERRKGNLLLLHWQSLRRGRPFPALADIGPESIPALWRFCFIAGRGRDGLVFSYVGHAVNRGYGMGEGPTTGGISRVLMNVLEGPCNGVYRSMRPELFEGVAPNGRGDELRYRACVCPLSENAGDVSHVFGLIDYVELRREIVKGVQIETDIDPDGL
ncbi:MAG: hypothetical protein WD673_16350 [Alphaproteobacteria bacterium]